MIREIKGIPGLVPTKRWRIKSEHHFGYLVENVNNKDEVCRLSRKGWEQATLVRGETK